MPFFLAVSLLTGVSLAGTRGPRGALIAQLVPADRRTGGPADRRVLTRAVRRQTAYVGLAVGSLIAGLGRVADSRPWYVGLILGDAATFVLAHWRQRGYRPRPPGHGAPVRLLLAALFVAVGPLISPVVRWADRTREAVRAGSTVAGVRAPATRVRTDDERATEPRREARTP